MIDFTNVSGGFEALPAGEYVAKITTAEVKATKAGDGQYLNIVWEIQDDAYFGRKVFDAYSFKANALWKLKGLLVAAGIPADGSVEVQPESFIDRQFLITLKIRTDDPTQNSVAKLKAI